MINIDQNSTQSIYEQIYEEFVKLISSKVLKPDDQMPSVRELASTIRINPNTIQRAYKLLESKSFIYSVPGKGNFVSKSDNLISAEISVTERKFVKNIKILKNLDVSNNRIIFITQSTLEGVDIDATNTVTE